MKELKDALCLFAGRFLDSSKSVKVIVSGSDREGEGEYKIFEYLSSLPLHEPRESQTAVRAKCLVLGKYVVFLTSNSVVQLSTSTLTLSLLLLQPKYVVTRTCCCLDFSARTEAWTLTLCV